MTSDMVMFGQEHGRRVMRALVDLPKEDKPDMVREAFMVSLITIEEDTGEVLLTDDEMAEKMRCSVEEVGRCMRTLQRMGVVRQEPGSASWFINPHVAWSGSLEERARLAKRIPPPLAG